MMIKTSPVYFSAANKTAHGKVKKKEDAGVIEITRKVMLLAEAEVARAVKQYDIGKPDKPAVLIVTSNSNDKTEKIEFMMPVEPAKKSPHLYSSTYTYLLEYDGKEFNEHPQVYVNVVGRRTNLRCRTTAAQKNEILKNLKPLLDKEKDNYRNKILQKIYDGTLLLEPMDEENR